MSRCRSNTPGSQNAVGYNLMASATPATISPCASPISGIFWAQTAALLPLMIALSPAVRSDLANDWWTDPTLSRGLLIPPLALYIAWLRRHITFSNPSASDLWGLLLTGAACLLFILGKLAAEFFRSEEHTS